MLCIEAIMICLIFSGCSYGYSELNGTTAGVKTILKGILFECSNEYNRKLKCEKNGGDYLAISIKTDPSFHINQLHQFLTLDHIYVANKFSTVKLVTPYVIEIIRGQPLMMFPLEFDKSITGKELENGFEIVNSNRYMNRYRQQDVKNKNIFTPESMMEDTENENSINEKRLYRYENNVGDGNRKSKNVRRYSVVNESSPIPFLRTTVKIFQKRYSSWWKLVPSITVDSYSGFYANGNLSVWFQYHINIFQLTKSINRLKNSKLLMPAYNDIEQLNNIIERENAQSRDIKVTTFLENCPYNSSILCINILDDIVAGYCLKIQLPFLENAYVKPNVFKVKIINVITDATVKDTVKVSISLVNEGFKVHDFAVNVNCLERIKINQTHKIKKLLPHVGETMVFILPFVFKKSNQVSQKVYCKIQVQTYLTISKKRGLKQQNFAQMGTQSLKNPRTVTTRKITVIPHQRCLCVWKCNCHCLANLETNVDFNVCQELDSSSQSKAGLLINSNYYELNEKDSDDATYNIQSFSLDCFWFAILIVLFMGFLGFCKAIMGICIPFVDKWGYDYLQPGRKYVDTSKLRHFFINLFYFILLPFLICCNCFTPSVEELLISNSENFMTKMYIYVYEVFYDNDPAIILIEETASSRQTDD